jgi:hypothetical protein
MRHLPFGIAPERHGLPLLVFAPQRGDWCIGKLVRMGLFLLVVRHPTPGLDRTHNGLTTGMDVDVLNRDLLLALAAVTVQRL